MLAAPKTPKEPQDTVRARPRGENCFVGLSSSWPLCECVV